MRLTHVLIAASIRKSLLLLLFASRMSAQTAVPVYEEPRHRLVLTHQLVRVMDVRIAPGDTTLFHIHDAPALYVTIAASALEVQVLGGPWAQRFATGAPGRTEGDVNTDTSYAQRPLTHRVTNVGTKPFRLIAVTNAAASPAVRDVAGMPGVLELRNRWFAQSRVRVSAGARTWYPVPTATIIVAPFGGPATVLLESGETRVLSAAGSWTFLPAGTRYQLSSTGSATLVVVQVM